MTAEDIAKGIVYSDDFETLLEVPNQETICISNLTKTIYGSTSSDYAFKKSISTLKNFTFMDNPILETIDSWAFYQCSSLQYIDLSMCCHLKSIGSYSFKECTSVQSVLFPRNGCLSSLGAQTFTFIIATKVIIPSSLTTISSAFFSTSIKEVIFDEGSKLASLPWGAFAYSEIYNFTVPPSVTSISGSAFSSTEMRYINVDPRNSNFIVYENALYNAQKTMLIYYPKLCTGNFIVPDTVTCLDESSFMYSQITGIQLSSNLITISHYAFQYTSFTTIKIPASVTTIETSAFSSSKLTEVIFEEPSSLTKIPNSCFYSCKSLVKVVLPLSIQEIGGAAFGQCSEDINITFADNSPLKFDQENSLIMSTDEKIISCYLKINDNTEVKIPAAATTIKSNCFSYQQHLKKITFLGDKITTIESGAFTNLGDIDFNLPFSLENIGPSAFSQTGITKIKLNILKTLQTSAFSNCKNLVSLEINQVSMIPSNCFNSCKNLEYITIHKGLTTIDSFAFLNCTKLSSFNSELKQETSSTKLERKNIFFVPNTLTSIGEKAFSNTNFDEILYQEGSKAKTIQDFAFYGSNFKSIKLPETITGIGTQAFSNTLITSFEVPINTLTIDRLCFSYCSQLDTFIIPSKCQLNTFGDSVFFSCHSLREIISNKNNFVVSNEALFDINLTKLIVYPPASTQYIFSLPQSIEMISVAAFYGAINLRSVQIPNDSLTIIGASAFEKCKKLQIISLPASITTIGSNAFKDCHQIQCGQVITVNENVQKVLITSAQFPERGLHPCEMITCMKGYPIIRRNTIQISFLSFLLM